jgi:anti-sigma regulatory factor (Ser/Thr protein kinase)
MTDVRWDPPAPLQRVALVGQYAFTHLERLIGDLAPIAALVEPKTLALDLTGLDGMCAPALAWLIAIVRRAQQRDLLADSFIIGPDGRLAGASPGSSLEMRQVRSFKSHEELRQAAAELSAIAAKRCELDPVAQFTLRICLDELAENVVFHANSPIGGVIAAPHVVGSGELEVGVVDLGVGIRASLRRNPELAEARDDVAAAITAMGSRVTATPDRNGGFGLAVTKLTIRANHGTMLVRSGFASVVAGVADSGLLTTLRLPGTTLVGLRIRTDQPLDVTVAYDHLADALDASLRDRGLDDAAAR